MICNPATTDFRRFFPRRSYVRFYAPARNIRFRLLSGMLGILFSVVGTAGAGTLDQARAYFDVARKSHVKFQAIPESARTQDDYQRQISAFKRVYLTSPIYGNNTICLMEIGQLYEQMGRRWQDRRYFESAIESYEFLLTEYSHSQFRLKARLNVGRIYQEDLLDLEAALAHYERFLTDYPKSVQTKTARAGIAEVKEEIAAKNNPVFAAPGEPAQTASRPPAPGGMPVVSDVRYWETPEYSRVVVDVGTKVKFEVGKLQSPDRLYIDLLNTRVATPGREATVPVDHDLLKRIRLAQFRPGVSRVVLDLNAMPDFSISELANPYRLVIDIPNAGSQAAKAGSAPSPPSDLESVRTADPITGGSHSLTRALGLKIGKILIDPGHGGHDTGTIGPSGLTEKEIVLDVSMRLGKMIEEKLGSEVVYTRKDDRFIPLESRTASANKLEADLFLSIHLNSSRSKGAIGIETYYLNFTSDPEALEVAARENSGARETIGNLQGLVQKIALQEKIDESREFATSVQDALLKSSLTKGMSKSQIRKYNRGVKKAPFVVLIGADMPSILAEMTFLSNPAEEKKLKSNEHRQKLAEALYSGVAAYVETLSGVNVARRSAPSLAAAKP